MLLDAAVDTKNWQSAEMGYLCPELLTSDVTIGIVKSDVTELHHTW